MDSQPLRRALLNSNMRAARLIDQQTGKVGFLRENKRVVDGMAGDGTAADAAACLLLLPECCHRSTIVTAHSSGILCLSVECVAVRRIGDVPEASLER
jgi:hypothetical protein